MTRLGNPFWLLDISPWWNHQKLVRVESNKILEFSLSYFSQRAKVFSAVVENYILSWFLPWKYSPISLKSFWIKVDQTQPDPVHSSEIRGLCLMEWPSETLQNLQYFWNTKTHIVFLLLYFLFPNECLGLCYVNIDQGIH